ncbi:MAG: tungsten formylmethanofuran dehydrogenase [Bacteroidetes bacterium]|nr:MAG: tungsten formylmethanofuran dehydrogenase [Bacteroidota bacterium]
MAEASTNRKRQLSSDIPEETLLRAFELMCTAKAMTDIYEKNAAVTSKYVHATSRGHEAIQLALGLQLKPQDWLSAYYRDDSILLGIGITPYELMLQLMAKRDDPFSGGRTYYSHPSLKRDDMPKIPHQSSATGMQAIPTTGIAMGIQYREKVGLPPLSRSPQRGESEGVKVFPPLGETEKGVVVCSLGDGSITEGEVSEAFQMAVLKKLPILYLVQDNEWDISAHVKEVRAQDAAEFAKGFHGLETRSIDGTDFFKSFETIQEVIERIRKERRPFLVHAKVPLLNHHTSGVRKEWYREDIEEQSKRDPFPRFRNKLIVEGFDKDELNEIESKAKAKVEEDYQKALKAEDPRPEDLFKHDYAPTPVTEEKGQREPKKKLRNKDFGSGISNPNSLILNPESKVVMVDCALFAIRELMEKHKECVFYGQDVGKRLGGVFREAATLAQKFGDDRVFNTPIQEAFIVGSTVGMSAVGLKPIVEVQFADYIWPGLNQLFTEVARSCYLTNGKYPVSMILRVPIGAYGSGGPYHSSSVESVVSNIRGIKVAYPSTGADLKGLMKAAYYDPNPVVILEHKGLYWSKIKGTEDAKTVEPDEDYIIPFGKARTVQAAAAGGSGSQSSITVITYGMGVYWAKNAAKKIQAAGGSSRVEIVDLRTLVPLDEETVFASVKKHSRCLVVTEEPPQNSFAQALAGLISENCFEHLDAPVRVIGSENLPAIPLNSTLEATMLPNADKVAKVMEELLHY